MGYTFLSSETPSVDDPQVSKVAVKEADSKAKNFIIIPYQNQGKCRKHVQHRQLQLPGE
jgi:hypothetical protein